MDSPAMIAEVTSVEVISESSGSGGFLSMTGDRGDETLVCEFAAARDRAEELKAELAQRGVIVALGDEGHYRSLFENSADAILVLDGDTVGECNQAAVDMLRCEDRQQILETHPSALSPAVQSDGRNSFEKANEMIRRAIEQGSHRFEWDHQRFTGEVFAAEVLLTPLPGAERVRIHAVIRDITQRKQLESQLRQSQKMEAMGNLAGGIAHDFNNLLMIINGNTERLLSSLGGDEEMADALRQISWAGQRAAELTAQLLASGRKQVLQPAILDLNQITIRTHDLLRRLIGENIRINTRPAAMPVMFKADPGLIEQTIINLATNARDAMPDGGNLDLEVSIHDIDGPATVDGLDLARGRYARLTVSDTGVGMEDGIRDRAFEPFFTTKPMGEGSGLGLSMVYGIVQQNGGHVIIRSERGAGTVVEIWFPTVDSPAADTVVEPELECNGDETILVVEDDEAVAAVVKTMLNDAGYTVLTSLSGLEALEVFAESGPEISLVLSDVVMPHMGGPEFARRLIERGYVTPVIFASGYTDDHMGSIDQLGFKADFLQKPFNQRTLLRAVRTAIDRQED